MKKTYLAFKANLPKIRTRRFTGVSRFGGVSYKTDGDASDDEDPEKGLKAELKNLQINLEKKASETAKTEAKEQVELQLKSVNEQLGKLAAAQEVGEIKSLLDKTVDAVERMATEVKSVPLHKQPETKSFNDILAETIHDNIDKIVSHKKGEGTKSFRLKGFEDEKIKEVKAVGDMSIAANFTGASNFTTDIRNTLIESPYDRVWLADILPGGTSNQSQSVLYPKENGGEGTVDPWTDPTADKVQIDFDLTTYSAYFKWLAGWVIIGREMLDDIPFMLSYLQSRMLISYKKAQNNLILNGTGDTNPVQGILDAATAYSGSMTTGVEKIIDAGWGQIVEDTDEFYLPTHTLLRPRAAVAVGLNKAAGSGEFDLPAGSVAFTNGKLTIGDITAVTTTNTNLAANDFVTFDKRAMMFITRMQPELRMFEDATLAKKNKIMFRIEGRATLAIFNDDAIVKGSLS